MTESWIFPEWPAPAQVHAAVSTRLGPGISGAPFERFNLGLRNGDRAEAVAANRSALQESLALPAARLHGLRRKTPAGRRRESTGYAPGRW